MPGVIACAVGTVLAIAAFAPSTAWESAAVSTLRVRKRKSISFDHDFVFRVLPDV